MGVLWSEKISKTVRLIERTTPAGAVEWIVDFPDPSSGRRKRVRVDAVNRQEAIQWAQFQHTAILEHKGVQVGGSGPRLRPILDLLDSAYSERYRTCNERTAATALIVGRKFCDWLKKEGVTCFSALRPLHVQGFAKQMLADGYHLKTIRHCLNAVHRAWVWAVENEPNCQHYPLPFSFSLRKFRLEPETRRRRGEMIALPIEEMHLLTELVRFGSPDLYPAILTLAMTGARVWEIFFLRIMDVEVHSDDIVAIRIDRVEGKLRGKNGQIGVIHDPKNSASYRTLPLPPTAGRAIRAQLTKRIAQDAGPSSPLFPVRAWKRFGVWSDDFFMHNNITSRCRSILVRAENSRRRILELQGMTSEQIDATPAINRYPVKYLRHAFMSACRKIGIPREWRQTYVGHSINDVADRHYEGETIHDLYIKIALPFEEAWHKSGTELENVPVKCSRGYTYRTG